MDKKLFNENLSVQKIEIKRKCVHYIIKKNMCIYFLFFLFTKLRIIYIKENIRCDIFLWKWEIFTFFHYFFK